MSTTSTISSVTTTICRLMGVEQPALAAAEPLREVLDVAAGQLGGGVAARVLVYAPDAIGRRFLERHWELRNRLERVALVRSELRSVLPAKTPVCFASMFTGAAPEAHGIRRYERPVLACDTLFDALVRAGRRVAIVAVRDSSIDLIFRDRPLDYFTEDSDREVTERTLELLREDRHDLILAYHQEYDDSLHATTPDSPAALAAARRHVETFARLMQAAEEHWAEYDRVVVFTPDHGAHVDPESGRGTHGDDVPEDIDLLHYWHVSPVAGEAVRRSWDEGADAWDDFVESGKDYYRTEVHGPGLLGACGEVAGRRALDIGCGQGYFSRRLAERGAEVVGIDVSEKQIEHARRHEREKALDIEYRVMDAVSVADHWPAGSFDLVTACMVMGDLPDAGSVLAAAHRLLADDGRFVFSDANPLTDTPVRRWDFAPDGAKRALLIDRYFETGRWTCQWNMKRLEYHWPGPGWRRTLSDWSTLIRRAGFLIRSITEPRPTAEQVERHPDLEDCRRLPYFMVLELVKQR